MGNCTRKRSRIVSAPPTSATSSRTLEELRESLKYDIIRYHQVVLNCRKGVEDSLINNDKETAILIRLKETYIRKQIEELQVMIEYLDNFMDQEPINRKHKQKILKQGNLLLKKNNNCGLASDDVSMILQNNVDYNQNIKLEVSKCGFNEKNVSLQIETEFQKRTVSKTSNSIRRRY